MKKLLLLVTMLLTLSLCACAADTPAPAPDVTPDTPQETSDTADTPEDGQTVDLPILSEIDQTVQVGTSGSYMTAVQAPSSCWTGASTRALIPRRSAPPPPRGWAIWATTPRPPLPTSWRWWTTPINPC